DEFAAEETARAARDQHREDDDRERVSRVSQQEHKLLNQRHLNQNIARAETQKIPQEFEYTLFLRQAAPQNQPRQHENQGGRGEAYAHQAEQQRHGAIDFVIGALGVGVLDEVPQIARLDGVEEERAIVIDGRNIVAV